MWVATTASAMAARLSGRALLARQGIHSSCQLAIELPQAAGLVGGQDNAHFVVNVRPLRMMVELFRRQRPPRHEAEGLVEIAEREAAFDGVSRTRELPAVESGQRLFRLRPVQLLSCHGCS